MARGGAIHAGSAARSLARIGTWWAERQADRARAGHRGCCPNRSVRPGRGTAPGAAQGREDAVLERLSCALIALETQTGAGPAKVMPREGRNRDGHGQAGFAVQAPGIYLPVE